MPESDNTELTASVPDEIYERIGFVIDRVIAMAPESAKNSIQYKMAQEFARGVKKDLKLLSPEQVKGFAGELARSLIWVAEGSMSDFDETETETDETGNDDI